MNEYDVVMMMMMLLFYTLSPLSLLFSSLQALAGSNPKQIRMWPHSHNRREIWATEGPSFGGITNSKSVLLIIHSFYSFSF